MRKLIGSYKGQNIYIFNIHIEGTCDSSPCGGIVAKKRIIETAIPKQCSRYFGNDRPVLMLGLKELDLKEPLPEDVVYAHIGTCCPFCGNYLNLVWLQETVAEFLARVLPNENAATFSILGFIFSVSLCLP